MFKGVEWKVTQRINLLLGFPLLFAMGYLGTLIYPHVGTGFIIAGIWIKIIYKWEMVDNDLEL